MSSDACCDRHPIVAGGVGAENGRAGLVIYAGPVQRVWERSASGFVWLAIAFVSAVAIHRMRFALPHAVTNLAPWSAINVAYRYDELTRWFEGASIYHDGFGRLTYPPATYVVLWPILGWLSLDSARVIFVATTLVAATIVAFMAYQLTLLHPLRERLLMISIVFASYPLQISVFLGHIPVQVVALVAVAAYLLTRARPSWPTDVAAGACLATSLVKPTLAPPLFAAVLIATWRVRPVLLSVGIYAAVSLVASAAQPAGIIPLHVDWLRANMAHALDYELIEALPNLHEWLRWAGLGRWGPAVSIVVLAAFCAWAWRRRHADMWLLIGAAALVARLWSYHRPYDDAVIMLVAIALLRTARGPDPRLRTPAAILFAATCAALLTPAWALYDLEPAAIRLVSGALTLLWITLLAFFLIGTRGHAYDYASPSGAQAHA